MESELYQMGWNDTLGTIRTATKSTVQQKQIFLRKLRAGIIEVPRTDPEYVKGVQEAAQRLLDRQAMEFKGPQEVIYFMNIKDQFTF